MKGFGAWWQRINMVLYSLPEYEPQTRVHELSDIIGIDVDHSPAVDGMQWYGQPSPQDRSTYLPSNDNPRSASKALG